MDPKTRIERTLEDALSHADDEACPPRLASAMRYSVFPGGARIRPRLCLAVASACGDTHPDVANAAGAAIELLHCASLVHDDLPCFDDASTRRGKASVHRAFDERIAVLTGDALIVLAFETLARSAVAATDTLAPLVLTIGKSVSVPSGIVAGQAWECEPRVDLGHYQRSKTGSLFSAATLAGAVAAGADPAPWRMLGDRIGEAYQVADDLHDVASKPEELGKPTGRDLALGRPNAAIKLGIEGAIRHLKGLVGNAIDSIPECDGKRPLRDLIMLESRRFVPKELRRAA